MPVRCGVGEVEDCTAQAGVAERGDAVGGGVAAQQVAVAGPVVGTVGCAGLQGVQVDGVGDVLQ